MLIFVRALAGTVIRLNVSPCETVQMVKTRISQLKGIPVSQQHLIFDGVELSNSTLLAAAQISHGALLRLVLGLQSGPLSREMVHPPGTAQPCHRLSSARQAMCPPMAPIHRIPASTVVLPVLCTPTRIPSGHQQPHYKHPYHSQLQYLASHVAACPPNQPAFYRPSNEWDEQDSYIPAEFAMDEETLGSNDDVASELAEYLGYAIDEDELNFEHTDVSTIRSAPDPESIAESLDEQADRISAAVIPPTSECRFVPVYPIPSHLQWIVDPTDLEQLTDSQSRAADDHDDGSVHPPESMTTPVTRFAPVPVAYGIPVPLATSKSDHHSRIVSPDPSGTMVTPTSSNPDSRPTLDPSIVSPIAFALPTHLRSAQLANLVSDIGWPVTSTGSFLPTATTATAAALAPSTTTTTTTSLIIPPFALFSLKHLRPEAVGTAADPEFGTRMNKDSDLSATTHSSDPNSMQHKLSSPLAHESNPTVHSDPRHIPETKKQFPSAIERSPLPIAIPDMRSTQPVAQTHCFSCQRRTRPAQGFSCRCQKWFCQKHHHPEDHNCAFDFKTMSMIPSCTTPRLPHVPHKPLE